MTLQDEEQTPRRILVVCTANVARSPLVGAVLHAHAQRRGLGDRILVDSAGVLARRGDAAAEHTRQIARRWGLDLDAHRSQPATEDLLAASHLIITMSQQQRDRCAGRGPGIGARCFTLPELARLAGHVDTAALPAGTPARFDAAIRALHRARPFSAAGDDEDVDDPYGRGFAEFAAMANRVAGLLTVTAEVLLGRDPVGD